MSKSNQETLYTYERQVARANSSDVLCAWLVAAVCLFGMFVLSLF